MHDTVDGDLDDDEFRLLSEAGIIPGSTAPKTGRRKPKHIVFSDGDIGVFHSILYCWLTDQLQSPAQKYLPHGHFLASEVDNDNEMVVEMSTTNLERKVTDKGKKPIRRVACIDEVDKDNMKPGQCDRPRLLTELAARLARDKQLRYAERELQMQRVMMGKGSRRKLRGAEMIKGGSEYEDEGDEVDAQKGKGRTQKSKVDERNYKPRVYKWRLERKR